MSSPKNLTVLQINTDSFWINWQPLPQSETNGAIIGYVINITKCSSSSIQQFSTTSTTLLAQNLTAFTTYSCIIAAKTSLGVGPFSEAIPIQTLEDGKQLFL